LLLDGIGGGGGGVGEAGHQREVGSASAALRKPGRRPGGPRLPIGRVAPDHGRHDIGEGGSRNRVLVACDIGQQRGQKSFGRVEVESASICCFDVCFQPNEHRQGVGFSFFGGRTASEHFLAAGFEDRKSTR